jgi:acyl-CoA synthetase (AMP-forming)/AMP-acid ligase II
MMRSFRTRLEDRHPDLPLLVTEQKRLRLDDLALPPESDTSRRDGAVPARIALSLRAPEALIAALARLDGRAEAILLVAPALPPGLVAGLVTASHCDYLVSDRADLPGAVPPEALVELGLSRINAGVTEWIMTTSGTTGQPKMVRHSLTSLTRTVTPMANLTSRPVWGLTYEPTRFAGMQVLLQACFGDGTLAVPDLGADIRTVLSFFARHGCSHLSATPTLWRRFLMHPDVAGLALRQITLGGEIADQAVLDALARRFPGARITHVYASTEAGVGFSVRDGREGFPASFATDPPKGVAMAVRDGRLWLSPQGSASEYHGEQRLSRDADGFIDTGDRVAQRDGRYVFLGRDTGVINIGGVKVHPEEVERVINALDGVGMVRVGARSNRLVGALLTAQIVPSEPVADETAFVDRVLAHCRAHLMREAVPAAIRLVDQLETNAAGKIRRA